MRAEAVVLRLCLVVLAALMGAMAASAGPSETWKSQIAYPFDPFLSPRVTFQRDEVRWIKFTIRKQAPDIVYFQDSGSYLFHYDFVSEQLDSYLGISRAAFDGIALHADGQELVLGAVLYSPDIAPGRGQGEYAIQLVRHDPYPVEEVVTLFETIRAAIAAPPATSSFYFPTLEQRDSALSQREALEAAGVVVDDASRWAEGNTCYSPGWALGRIVQVDAEEIDAAYAAGAIGPEDILLTDGVPAEIPFFSGVLSLRAATPASHVAILARNWNIPFAFLAIDEDAARAQALAERQVVLRARGGSGCRVHLLDVDGNLAPELTAELLDLKAPPLLALPPLEVTGRYSDSVENLSPEDIVRFGGKAANYGLLRDAIPDQSRPAIAFSFDLWQDFLDQTLAEGGTLRDEVAARLAPFASYPPDFAAVHDVLAELRGLIESETSFSAVQEAAIEAALTAFDPLRRLRFRSSTNFEDSEVFTGAGLFSSFNGCLADDQDGDELGPSLCDATRAEERGVYRAIRRVYASFYNENAFLERLRHGVDEEEVAMGLLVHHSFPDEIEEANGVVTLERRGGTSYRLVIVSQPGAHSVTNPDQDGAPEVITGSVFSSGSISLSIEQGAERLPLGETVLGYPDEYKTLVALLLPVADAYASHHGLTQFSLEFEFKRITAEGIVVKQVRRLPDIAIGPSIAPYLLNDPSVLCIRQGEFGDVFANHRLKSRWWLETENRQLTPGQLLTAFYSSVTQDYATPDAVETLSGEVSSWPEASHQAEPGLVRDGWRLEGPRRRLSLEASFPPAVNPSQSPILTPDELGYQLTASYDEPQPKLRFLTPATTVEEFVYLESCLDQKPLTSRHLRREISGAVTEGVAFETTFYHPPGPTGASAGYTAPLDRWVATTLYGLSPEPLVLYSEFAQSYRPGHHNFTEDFLFDPLLDPDVSPLAKDEWRANGFDLLFVHTGFGLGLEPTLLMLGQDGVFRSASNVAPDTDGDGISDGLDECPRGESEPPNTHDTFGTATGPAIGCPEPSARLLALTALVALGGLRRVRRS